MIRLVPPLMASCVMRHMRFKSDGRRTSGTGTLPKRFISQPYAGILKWDSSSHPRTNCGMAQYSMKGSNRLTWLAMKKDVRWASKPPERRAWTCAPAETALQPIMLARIQKDAEKDQQWHNKKEMQTAEDPQDRAAYHQPGPFHIQMFTAAGRMSSARHSSVSTSPSIMISTGAVPLNST